MLMIIQPLPLQIPMPLMVALQLLQPFSSAMHTSNMCRTHRLQHKPILLKLALKLPQELSLHLKLYLGLSHQLSLLLCLLFLGLFHLLLLPTTLVQYSVE